MDETSLKTMKQVEDARGAGVVAMLVHEQGAPYQDRDGWWNVKARTVWFQKLLPDGTATPVTWQHNQVVSLRPDAGPARLQLLLQRCFMRSATSLAEPSGQMVLRTLTGTEFLATPQPVPMPLAAFEEAIRQHPMTDLKDLLAEPDTYLRSPDDEVMAPGSSDRLRAAFSSDVEPGEPARSDGWTGFAVSGSPVRSVVVNGAPVPVRYVDTPPRTRPAGRSVDYCPETGDLAFGLGVPLTGRIWVSGAPTCAPTGCPSCDPDTPPAADEPAKPENIGGFAIGQARGLVAAWRGEAAKLEKGGQAALDGNPEDFGRWTGEAIGLRRAADELDITMRATAQPDHAAPGVGPRRCPACGYAMSAPLPYGGQACLMCGHVDSLTTPPFRWEDVLREPFSAGPKALRSREGGSK